MSTSMLRLLRLALRKTVQGPAPETAASRARFVPLADGLHLDDVGAEIAEILGAQGPARTFDRSRTRMPVRGFDTAVPRLSCAPAMEGVSKRRHSGTRLGEEKAPANRRESHIRDQQIVRGAALILGEGRPPVGLLRHMPAPDVRAARVAVVKAPLQPDADWAMTPSNAGALLGV